MSEDTDLRREQNFQHIMASRLRHSEIKTIQTIMGMSQARRRRALRDWQEEPIEDPFEVAIRDDLDKILHMCGILEIGMMLGATRPIGNILSSDLLPLLQLPEVRTYYTRYYPTALTAKFLKRIERGGAMLDTARFDIRIFNKVMLLESYFNDARLETFLSYMDGFWFEDDDTNFDDLLEAVASKKTVARALTTKKSKRTPLQEGICGLERFFFFCQDLCRLLEETKDDATASQAIFELYEYWFVVMHDDLTKLVDMALETMSRPDRIAEEPLPEIEAMRSLFVRAVDRRIT